MRTTLTIDDSIAKVLKEIAYKTGKPYKQVVNETLRTGITAKGYVKKSKPYRLKPASLGMVSAEYNVTKALQLADHLEDEEIVRKLDMRK